MKKKITVILISILVLSMAAAFFLIYSGTLQITSPQRRPDMYHGSLSVSSDKNDTDNDGVKDGQDIVDGAVAYIETRPKYKSRYYSTGYPDDGYGTCTDVVGAAMKNAGYDLMELVQKDIRKDPSAYEIDVPDAKIDFRRVRNLNVFFQHTAASLTTDVTEIDQWQGGDIVVFQNHIGIVSDHRNEKGIPYIIHHTGPFQLHYEEDILAQRRDIIGHYRAG